MKKELSQITAALTCGAGASDQMIRDAEGGLGFRLPSDYVEFVRECNGGEGPIGTGAYLRLWQIEQLIKQNTTYRVGEFAPELLLIGTDGGGEMYGYDTSAGDMPIVAVPDWPMGLCFTYKCANSFEEFLQFLYRDQSSLPSGS